MTEVTRTEDNKPMTFEESIRYGFIGVAMYIALMTFFLLVHLEVPFIAAFYYYVEVCLSAGGVIALCSKVTLRLVTRYPRLRETHNPIPDSMPGGAVVLTLIAITTIILVGVNYGTPAAGMALLTSFFLGALAMHGIPWAKHQLRLSGWLRPL